VEKAIPGRIAALFSVVLSPLYKNPFLLDPERPKNQRLMKVELTHQREYPDIFFFVLKKESVVT